MHTRKARSRLELQLVSILYSAVWKANGFLLFEKSDGLVQEGGCKRFYHPLRHANCARLLESVAISERYVIVDRRELIYAPFSWRFFFFS